MSTFQEKVLVTGGGGFLGSYICNALKARDYQVVSLSRSRYPHLAKMGVEQIQSDLTSLASLENALHGCQAVIHTAAKAGVWGSPQAFYQTNVIGTENLITAAHNTGINKLVYTSSPSVAFARHNIEGADESIPYAKDFDCPYPHTKKLAEEKVLNAHGKNGLACVALRPHLIWGPGDPHFLPRLKQRAQEGKLRQIGSLQNKVDIIYVENAAEAHLTALQSLTLTSPHAGKAYFIGQERPVNLWGFVNELLGACQLPPLRKNVPFSLAFGIGGLLEWIYKIGNIYDKEPPMTRFLALQLAKSHYFSHKNAEKDFGYKPRISIEEGLKRLSSAVRADSKEFS